MAWPCRQERWGDKIDLARDCVAQIANAIADFEPVTMLANPENVAEVSLRCGSGVSTLPMLRNDSLVRDMGPSFLIDGRGGHAGVDWLFDGWSERMVPYDFDAALAAALLDHVGMERFTPDVVMEPGAFHVDGEGTLIATEHSLLSSGRNQGVTSGDLEALLKAYLGISKVIWLPQGLTEDSRDQPVEDVARFIAPGVVLALTCDDPSDANHTALSANLACLKESTDAQGRPLQVIEVHQPAATTADDGRRLGLSYLNFYIANGGVVMPAFEDGKDEAAFAAIRAACPEREVVQISIVDLMEGAGIHSITLQQPS